MSPKKRFKWSSHTPAIRTALQLVPPQLVVELGVGNYSTPLFLQSSAQRIVHIENNKQWLDDIQAQYHQPGRNEFRWHSLPDKVKNSTLAPSLPTQLIEQCQQYYQNLKQEVADHKTGPKLLFVDHYASLRTLAINVLTHQFDIVIYHDAEVPEVYEYQHIDTALSETFQHWTLKTASSWTGFMIRKNLIDAEILHQTMMDQCELFGRDFNRPRQEFSFVLL